MADVVVPQMSEVASEIVLVRWLRTAGDRINAGEPLFELDTDKYVVEIEAFEDGVLDEVLVAEGSVVEPGQVIACLRIADEGSHEPATVMVEPTEATTPARPASVLQNKTASPVRVLATPKARQVARELGVDIGSIVGTGRGGVVTAADVADASATPPPLLEPLSAVRQAIGARMQASKRNVPHFYLMVDVDMSAAVQLRGVCVTELGWARAPMFTDLIVVACARALRQLPEVNIRLENEGVRRRASVDIGIAVDCDDGLRVPVVARVDELELRGLSEATRAAVERARRGRLLGSDLVERSMVVSNLGMHGVDGFIAIVDPPDPMILAAGQVVERCVAAEGVPTVSWRCTLTLSADHRVFDGVIAARFVGCVKDELESAHSFLADAA